MKLTLITLSFKKLFFNLYPPYRPKHLLLSGPHTCFPSYGVLLLSPTLLQLTVIPEASKHTLVTAMFAVYQFLLRLNEHQVKFT